MQFIPKDNFPSEIRANNAQGRSNQHPIEERVKSWEETATAMKMDQYKRLFGAADPIKREMDLALVGDNLHGDILKGKDWSIDWEDVYK